MKNKMDLIQFEILSESKTGNLIGGFSGVINSSHMPTKLAAADKNTQHCEIIGNNCNGANCAKACSALIA